jgi:hypothetical protein
VRGELGGLDADMTCHGGLSCLYFRVYNESLLPSFFYLVSRYTIPSALQPSVRETPER